MIDIGKKYRLRDPSEIFINSNGMDSAAQSPG
jgi:hypothetical protein